MFSQDYVLRMLRQAAAVLAQALRLKTSGRYIEAEQSIAGALEGLTGLPFDLSSRLDDGSLLEHLRSPEGELDLDRLLAVADLTRLHAELLSGQGRRAESEAAALRALSFYLEAAFSGPEAAPALTAAPAENEEEVVLLPLEAESLDERIESTAGRLELEALPPDTLFSLYQYYEMKEDYAKAARAINSLAGSLPGDEAIRQELEMFFLRLLSLPEADLNRHGFSRAGVEQRLRDLKHE